MNSIGIEDKKFKIFITRDEISVAVQDIANKINRDFAGKEVVFIGVLNGAFMFASDLLKKITLKNKVSFIRYQSYKGLSSTGSVEKLLEINEDIKNKSVVVLEDIIDSGLTIENLKEDIAHYNPAVIKIAALLVKSGNFNKKIIVDYTGFEITNDFIIGYGLDYNGYGRNLEDIYILTS